MVRDKTSCIPDTGHPGTSNRPGDFFATPDFYVYGLNIDIRSILNKL